MSRGLWFAIFLVIGGACTGSPAATPLAPDPGGAGGHVAGPAADDGTPFTIRIVTARYGKLIIATRPDATCRARATLPSGNVVLAHDFLVDQHPDADGQAIWAYRPPAAVAVSGTAQYWIGCTVGDRSVETTVDFEAQ